MAETKDDNKDDKKKYSSSHGGGTGLNFGTEILLFLIALFVIWVLVGKPKTENADKPFIKGQPLQQIQ